MWIDKRVVFTPEQRLEKINELVQPILQKICDNLVADLALPLNQSRSQVS